jgi:hypothetical protein
MFPAITNKDAEIKGNDLAIAKKYGTTKKLYF